MTFLKLSVGVGCGVLLAKVVLWLVGVFAFGLMCRP